MLVISFGDIPKINAEKNTYAIAVVNANKYNFILQLFMWDKLSAYLIFHLEVCSTSIETESPAEIQLNKETLLSVNWMSENNISAACIAMLIARYSAAKITKNFMPPTLLLLFIFKSPPYLPPRRTFRRQVYLD
jgi:hypothetical protein